MKRKTTKFWLCSHYRDWAILFRYEVFGRDGGSKTRIFQILAWSIVVNTETTAREKEIIPEDHMPF